MFKPELLLPAGTMDSFYAALEGGADAVYLGLKKFNARNRAANFNYNDFQRVIYLAKRANIKVYVTLNTLIKNSEISDLIDYLFFLSQNRPDALIVQDFAVINIVRKHFPALKLHASTQMAVHNQIGVNNFSKMGIERVILSRELSLSEIETVAKESKSEIEIFVHGALCYSLSGHCLFSSYLSGNSANRGMCAQICRRSFIENNHKCQNFSLKDFQLIEYVPSFSKLKIRSLKIEGRMKSPEYVYNVARAYRMVIDDHSRISEAQQILKYDYAREKTQWFVGKDVKNAITQKPGTGIYTGNIISVFDDAFEVNSIESITKDSKIRVRNYNDTESDFIKINNVVKQSNVYKIYCSNIERLNIGDEVYIVGDQTYKPKVPIGNHDYFKTKTLSYAQKEKIRQSYSIRQNKKTGDNLLLRVSEIADLDQHNISRFNKIIYKTHFANLEKLLVLKLSDSLKRVLYLELPKFISPNKIEAYKTLLSRLFKIGYRFFALSHLSQIDILPTGSSFMTNENVFVTNDIAASFVASTACKDYCYPFEIDYPNLLKARDRNGIIPVYFYPELFYSRMPVNIPDSVKDESGKTYNREITNGFTVITENKPVSFTHNINKLKSKGFYKFLIDFSTEKDLSKLDFVLKSFFESTKIPNSLDFNFKKELH